MRKKYYRASYTFWRIVGGVAIRTFHASQTLSHRAYLKGGKTGRRAKRPLTAIYKFVQRLRAQIVKR